MWKPISIASLALFCLATSALGQDSAERCSVNNENCRPVNSGELFIAIAPWTFFPFMILWIGSFYLGYWDELGSCCQSSRQPTIASASASSQARSTGGAASAGRAAPSSAVTPDTASSEKEENPMAGAHRPGSADEHRGAAISSGALGGSGGGGGGIRAKHSEGSYGSGGSNRQAQQLSFEEQMALAMQQSTAQT